MSSAETSLHSLSEADLADLNPAELAEVRDKLAQLEFFEERKRQRDLVAFARAAWEFIEPSTPLIWNWHLDLIAEYLQLVRAGQIRRLIINVPPQTTKSRFVTVFFPAWYWATDPSRRFMCASYSGGSLGLSTMHSNERRRILDSDWFRSIAVKPFGWTQFTQQQYENDCGGRMIATSPGGTATGKGVHCIILDDLVNPKQAESEADRTSAISFVDQTLRSRLSDQITGAIIVVEQRLHERDVTGHLLAKEPGVWTHVSIPMVAEKDEEITFPISKRVIARKKGELLWPERFPQWTLDSLKLGLGTRYFSAQYQQRPTPAEGVIFNPGHWKYYKRGEEPKFEIVGMSVDCAFKEAMESDNVAIHVYGCVGPRNYLIELDTCRRGYAATKAAIKAMKVKYKQLSVCLIEDKANGSAVIEELGRTSTGMSIIAVNPQGGKTARAWAAQPDQEAGNCYLPEEDDDATLFVDDMAKFRGEGSIPNDDDVDAFTQWVNWRRMHSFGFFDWAREKAEEIDEKKKAFKADNGNGSGNGTGVEQNVDPVEIAKANTRAGMVTAMAESGSVGRVFGAQVNKISNSTMTKPLVNNSTPKCPKCGNVNLTRRENARGQKIESCGSCGWNSAQNGAFAK